MKVGVVRSAGVVGLSLVAGLSFGQYKITDLDPGGYADPVSYVYLNQSGSVLQDDNFYVNGHLTQIPSFQGAGQMAGESLNDTNQAVGYTHMLSGYFVYQAFSYNGTSTGLGLMGGSSSYATGISNNGTIVGDYEHVISAYQTVQRGFKKVGNTVTTLNQLYSTSNGSSVYGITNSGIAYGDSGDVTGQLPEPVIWTSSAATLIPLANGFVSGAAVSANSLNQIFVNEHTAAGVSDMFMYSNGTLTELPNLPGGSGGFGMNAEGEIAATGYDAHGNFEVGIFKPGVGWITGQQLVAGSAFNTFQPMAINDAGQIAGVGNSPTLGSQLLLLTPVVPEPAPLAVLSLGAVVVLRRRRR